MLHGCPLLNNWGGGETSVPTPGPVDDLAFKIDLSYDIIQYMTDSMLLAFV